MDQKSGTKEELLSLRASDERLRAVIGATFDALIVIDRYGHIALFNTAAVKLFCYSEEEVLGKNVSMLMPREEAEHHDEHLERYISTGKQRIIGTEREVLGMRRDGTTFPIELAVTEVAFKNERFFVGTIQNVSERRNEYRQQQQLLQKAHAELETRVKERTAELAMANQILEKEVQERKRAEEVIAATLREKEVFLKEIHHRVKNNLQLVISIVNLHMHRTGDDRAIDTLSEIRDRIYAIAHLHETLYQSGDLTKVNIEEYIRGLVTNLIHSSAEIDDVDVSYDIDSVSLNIDETLRCGLIINELVLNSLKHAFTGRLKGRIAISARKSSDNGEVSFTVSDDGVGLPKNPVHQESRSIGFHLVEKLTEKLGGTVRYSSTPGAKIEISFLPEKK